MLTNRPASLKRICKIDMTAFAAVLVILFFLMMFLDVTGLNPPKGTWIDLPKVNHPVQMPNAMREDALAIGIMRDGKIFFGGDRTTAAQLPAKIEERLRHGAERKVYIHADARVKYGVVGMVLDGIRSAGVENVGILVEGGVVRFPAGSVGWIEQSR
jgi:biopolymer transport protein ExbD